MTSPFHMPARDNAGNLAPPLAAHRHLAGQPAPRAQHIAAQPRSPFQLYGHERDRDGDPRKVTEAEFEAMSAAERIEYARQFDQSRMPANPHDGAR